MMQLRLGIVGLGFRSPLVKHWHQPDGDSIITAVADLNQEAIDTFKETIAADVYATNNFQELLERDDVDAVVILTEDYKHKEHALQVLAAGKHLYLDKPMAISIEDCDEIYRAWQASGQKMMIGFNMRYMPMYQDISMKALSVR
ncbi:Gfo/Idh/MocA family protein [Dolosigranulum pigrum]|uniref:Gfo/Idh/MocA family protein n=1 Tax=Dolosigranulum pigrum TaxID=29394 RepID=UPI001AD903D7|nr:Gfo/Idh/MocA family oxidoreductase [Dolosigranulum pigrum]